MAKSTRRPPKVPTENISATPRELPTMCPLFPTVATARVGKVTLQRVEYDEGNEAHHVMICHQRVNAEMDENDVADLAGGGEFVVTIHRNDGTGQILGKRKLEIEGEPKGGADDDEDDTDEKYRKPLILTNADGSHTVLPNLPPGELAAYLAQQDRIKSLERQAAEGGAGGGMAGMMGNVMAMQMKASENSTQLMVAMLTGGGKNDAATSALTQQLNALNLEKLTMLQQHGALVMEMRKEHLDEVSRLRDEMAKDRDALRTTMSNADLERKAAVAAATARGNAEIERLTRLLNKAESDNLDLERKHLHDVNSSRGSSDMIEFAKLAAPRVDALLGAAKGAGALPPELAAAVKAITEMAPTVKRLAVLANQLPAGMLEDPPAPKPAAPKPAAPEPAPVAAPEQPAPAATEEQPAPQIPVPGMPA